MTNVDTFFYSEADLRDSLLLVDEENRTLIEKELITYAIGDESIISNLKLYKEKELGGHHIADILVSHSTQLKEKKYFDLHVFELKKDDVTYLSLGQV